MTTESLVIWLLVGLIAGALAGRVVDGGGFGIVGDIVVGIIGAFIGGWLLHSVMHVATANSLLMDVIVSFIGACVLLFLLRVIAGQGTRHSRML